MYVPNCKRQLDSHGIVCFKHRRPMPRAASDTNQNIFQKYSITCKFLGPSFESTGMQHSAPFPTKIGIFWFYGKTRGRSKFLGLSRESNTASVINGSRALKVAHNEGWSLLQHVNPEIRDFNFDYFRRGRLTWDQSNGH